MKIRDVFKQKEGKWIDYIELVVYAVSEPESCEYGFVQKLEVCDEVGKFITLNCYAYQMPCTDTYIYVENDCISHRCAFSVKHKKGILTGRFTETIAPEKRYVDYETIGFGKCRHGILLKCINSVEDLERIDIVTQKKIVKIAHFSMYGFMGYDE